MSGNYRGVQMNLPSAMTADAIRKSVEDFFKDHEDNTLAVAGVLTPVGTNLVIVKKVNNNVFVKGWIGKEWGEPQLSYGIEGVLYF